MLKYKNKQFAAYISNRKLVTTVYDSLQMSARFAVYEKKMMTKANEVYTERLIVLKNKYNVVLFFTRLEIYAGPYKGRVKKRSLEIRAKHELEYICRALNYILFDNYATFQINMVCRITEDMIFDFFDNYRTVPKPNGEFRLQQSINSCVSAVSNFFANVSVDCKDLSAIAVEDIMQRVEVKMNRKSQKVKAVYIPLYQKKSIQKVAKPILRDIPTKAINLLLELSYIYAPDITFAMICSITAGLRGSENMNVRRITSSLGPGISITYQGSTPITVEIDLRKELMLRSDGVRVGGIKKERIQKVYPPFIPMFLDELQKHQEYLAGKKYETDYGPMFINRSGKAMNYKTYLQKFQTLVDEHLRPALLQSDDPALHVLGHRLTTEKLSTHALRHYFTVILVSQGEDIAQIQYFRGDSSPESALWYMQNKGALIESVGKAHERAINTLIDFGGYCHSQEF